MRVTKKKKRKKDDIAVHSRLWQPPENGFIKWNVDAVLWCIGDDNSAFIKAKTATFPAIPSPKVAEALSWIKDVHSA